MVDNRHIEYLDMLIIPTNHFITKPLAIKKDGSKDIQKDLSQRGKTKAYMFTY